MNDKRKAPRTSDTLPAKGRVNEVCKEWLVHEDGALAYQLQKQEVEEHYSGNKTRNAQVREDLPRAKEEQQREERDAFARYQERLQHQADQDEYLAMKVAENLEREEERQRRKRELRDEEIARRIQEKEQDRLRGLEHVSHVGLPLSQEPSDVSSHFRSLDLNSIEYDDESPTSMDLRCVLNDSELHEEAQRRLQEQKDEELARLLQEQDSGSLSLEDRDRLLAMEAQDKELARLLQEKEKARARRARERAKQRALLKKQQAFDQQQQLDQTTARGSNSDPHNYRGSNFDPANSRGSTLDPHNSKAFPEQHNANEYLDSPECEPEIRESSFIEVGAHVVRGQDQVLMNSSNDRRYYDENKVEACASNNIATAIDPTFSTLSSTYSCDTEKCVAPPYMPIQGQRRTSSLEKKSKKKDGCKNQ